MARGADQRRWEKEGWEAGHLQRGPNCNCSHPADRCGPPESAAGQAKIPQEAGEGDAEAHTAEEVSVYENQGELTLGGAYPPGSCPQGLPPQHPLKQRHKVSGHSSPWVGGRQLLGVTIELHGPSSLSG